MANKIFRGDSQPIAQVSTVTIGGSPATNDTYSVTINRKTITYTETAVSPTVTIVATGLAALLSASDLAEFREITWTSNSGVITGTASVPGVPFTCTVAKTGSGTIALATPTASSGPFHIDDANNWNPTAANPGKNDVVFIDVPNGGGLYGLANFTTAALGNVTILRGSVGLPDLNQAGYQEYRTKSLPIAGGSTQVLIGDGTQGPDLCRIDFGADTPVRVDTGIGGSGQTDGPPILFTNSAGAVTLTLDSGSVGLAFHVGDTFAGAAVVGTLGPEDSFGATDEQAVLAVGSGATLSTLKVYGGSVTVFGTVSGATTVKDGFVTARDGSSWNGLTVTGGTILWQTGSAMGTCTFTGENSVLDLSGDTRAVSGTLTFTQGARLIDPNRRLSGVSVTFDPASLAASKIGPATVAVTL